MFQDSRYKGSEGDDRVPTHTQQSELISGKRGEKGPWGIRFWLVPSGDVV